MIRNYFKTAWRNLVRNKVNSFINIAGLAIGLACVILISLYVQDELRYDRFFKDSDRIYQVNMSGVENGNEYLTGNTAPAVGPAMADELAEIETYVRIHRPGDKMVRYEEGKEPERYFTEKGIMAVDSNFLHVFTYQMMEGDPATCLEKPNSLVITERTAKKYFGDSNPIGKVLLFDTEKTPFTVTGILSDIPPQSSFQFDMLVPVSAHPNVERRSWNWFWLQMSTYVKLRDNIPADKKAVEKLEAKFPAIVKKHAFQSQNQTFDEFIKEGGKLGYHLQPFTSVHLHAANMGTASRLTTLGNIKYVYIFSVVAFFIITLACVNFMNLSTAQSIKRAKEVGIRKVLGSIRIQLIKQFLAEALLYSFIATIIALILVLLFLKPFNEISGKAMGFNSLIAGNLWPFILGLSVLTGLLAGSYPAFYLTSFKPVTVLRNLKMFKSNLGNLFIRNGLVVFQFTISTALIICTIIVFNQLKFTQNKNLGFNKENILAIANTDRLGKTEENFRQELTKMPGIINASLTSCTPVRENFADVYIPEKTGGDKPLVEDIVLSSFKVDYDFIPTLDIQLLFGRNFSRDFSDSASVIINETALKQIGWKDPIGKSIDYPGNSQIFRVIGVAKNFHIGSLQTEIVPFALFHTSSMTYDLRQSYTLAKMKPGNPSGHLEQIEKSWKKFAPGFPFEYSFLDSELEALYRSEKRMGNVFFIFSIISIFVACLGLFGLAAYTAERRTKEIGVRKVLGASVKGLVALLSKDFVRLVLLSAIVAFPVAWWFMHKWLQDFAYRISIEWWVFVVAGMAALLIALLTVCFQAIKTANANPVKSLRTE